MILRNLTFQEQLAFESDHVCTMEIRSPRLFGRVIQSMIAMEAGDSPPEPFQFVEHDALLDPQKLLYVVTDPFHIDMNSRKNLTMLYTRLSALLAMAPEKQAEWQTLTANAADLVDNLLMQIPCDLEINGEMSLSAFCKETEVRFADDITTEPLSKILRLMDLLAEFAPRKLLVLCNTAPFLSEKEQTEMMKYACYTKVQLLRIEATVPSALYENEVRWTISPDFDDRIQKM